MTPAEYSGYLSRVRFERTHPIRVVYADGSWRRFTNLIAGAEAALATDGVLVWEGHRMSEAGCKAITTTNRLGSDPLKRETAAKSIAAMYVRSDLSTRKLAA